MAGQGDVRQGRAYVELFVKNSALVKGLQDAAQRLRSFGSGVASIGKWAMAGGAAITGPLALAAKVAADSGSALWDMSQRTGMSVENLSALKYAAEQSGAGLEEVEAGARKMQKNLVEASQGSKQSKEAFERLGLSVSNLMKMSPDQQFAAIGSAIAAIGDPTKRAAMAMEIFGRSGTALVPALQDLSKLRADAGRLGLIISTDDARTADDFGDTLGDLQQTLKAVWQSIGNAVIPVLKEWSEIQIGVAQGVRRLIDENRKLVGTALQVSSALLVGGGAVALFGFALEQLGKIAGQVNAVIGLAGKAIDWMVAPFRAAVSAVIGFATGIYGLIAASVQWVARAVILRGVMLAWRAAVVSVQAAMLACRGTVALFSAVFVGVSAVVRGTAAALGLASVAAAGLRGVFTAAVVGIQTFQQGVDLLRAGVKSVWQFAELLGDLAETCARAGVSVLSLAGDMLSGAVRSGFQAIQTGVSGALVAIESLGAGAASLGTALVSGIATLGVGLISAAITGAIIALPLAIAAAIGYAAIRTAAVFLQALGSALKSAMGTLAGSVSAAGDLAVRAGSGLMGVFSRIPAMVEPAKKAFWDLAATAQSAWKGVSDALAAGDMALAGRVAVAGLMVAFEQLKQAIMPLWVEVKDGFLRAFIEVKAWLLTFVENIKTAFSNLIASVTATAKTLPDLFSAFLDVAQAKVTRAANATIYGTGASGDKLRAIAGQTSTAQDDRGVAIAEANARTQIRLAEDQAAKAGQATTDTSAIDAARKRELAARDAALAADRAGLGDGEAQQALAQAEKDLLAATKAAAAARAQRQAAPGMTGANGASGLPGEGVESAKKIKTMGTFSSWALPMMGGDTAPQQATTKAVQQVADLARLTNKGIDTVAQNVVDVVRKLENMIPRFGSA